MATVVFKHLLKHVNDATTIGMAKDSIEYVIDYRNSEVVGQMPESVILWMEIIGHTLTVRRKDALGLISQCIDIYSRWLRVEKAQGCPDPIIKDQVPFFKIMIRQLSFVLHPRSYASESKEAKDWIRLCRCVLRLFKMHAGKPPMGMDSLSWNRFLAETMLSVSNEIFPNTNGWNVGGKIDADFFSVLFDTWIRSMTQESKMWKDFKKRAKTWCSKLNFIQAWGTTYKALTDRLINVLYGECSIGKSTGVGTVGIKIPFDNNEFCSTSGRSSTISLPGETVVELSNPRLILYLWSQVRSLVDFAVVTDKECLQEALKTMSIAIDLFLDVQTTHSKSLPNGQTMLSFFASDLYTSLKDNHIDAKRDHEESYAIAIGCLCKIFCHCHCTFATQECDRFYDNIDRCLSVKRSRIFESILRWGNALFSTNLPGLQRLVPGIINLLDWASKNENKETRWLAFKMLGTLFSYNATKTRSHSIESILRDSLEAEKDPENQIQLLWTIESYLSLRASMPNVRFPVALIHDVWKKIVRNMLSSPKLAAFQVMRSFANLRNQRRLTLGFIKEAILSRDILKEMCELINKELASLKAPKAESKPPTLRRRKISRGNKAIPIDEVFQENGKERLTPRSSADRDMCMLKLIKEVMKCIFNWVIEAPSLVDKDISNSLLKVLRNLEELKAFYLKNNRQLFSISEPRREKMNEIFIWYEKLAMFLALDYATWTDRIDFDPKRVSSEVRRATETKLSEMDIIHKISLKKGGLKPSIKQFVISQTRIVSLIEARNEKNLEEPDIYLLIRDGYGKFGWCGRKLDYPIDDVDTKESPEPKLIGEKVRLFKPLDYLSKVILKVYAGVIDYTEVKNEEKSAYGDEDLGVLLEAESGRLCIDQPTPLRRKFCNFEALSKKWKARERRNTDSIVDMMREQDEKEKDIDREDTESFPLKHPPCLKIHERGDFVYCRGFLLSLGLLNPKDTAFPEGIRKINLPAKWLDNFDRISTRETYTFAVLYGHKEMSDLQMAVTTSSDQHSKLFIEFMSSLGRLTLLDEHLGFTGDLSHNTGNSLYYSNDKHHEICYHVPSIMDPERADARIKKDYYLRNFVRIIWTEHPHAIYLSKESYRGKDLPNRTPLFFIRLTPLSRGDLIRVTISTYDPQSKDARLAEYNSNTKIRSELSPHVWQFKKHTRYRYDRRTSKDTNPLCSVGPLLNNMVVATHGAALLVRETAINAMNKIKNIIALRGISGKVKRERLIRECSDDVDYRIDFHANLFGIDGTGLPRSESSKSDFVKRSRKKKKVSQSDFFRSNTDSALYT